MTVTFGQPAAPAAVVLTITRPGAPATSHAPAPVAELLDQITAYMTEHLGALPPVNVPGSLAHRLANTPTGTDVHDPATGATFRLDPAPAAQEGAPAVVEIRWTERDGQRLTGLMTLASVSPADRARVDATDREDQWLITGGTRRATLDGMNDYTDESHHFDRLTPEAAARAAADWLGLADRPVRHRIVHEWRDGA